MVGKLKIMKGNSFMKSILTLCMVQVSFSYAGEFYTIIGPDGRPMVVQQKVPAKSIKSEQTKQTVKESLQEVLPQQNSATHVFKTEQAVIVKESQHQLPQNNNAKVIQIAPALTGDKVPQYESQSSKNIPKAKKSEDSELSVESDLSKGVEPKISIGKKVKKQKTDIIPVEFKVEKEDVEAHSKIDNFEPKQPSMSRAVNKQATEDTEAFATIDGEKYIKNEYLEDKEFNLEGKKRFYTMPEGIIDTKHGATRLQVVEREKGVSKSLLQSFFNKKQQQDSGPITLSSTYYRVSQADAVNSLGHQCIQDKKIKDAKTVSLNKDINVWPRAPLKEQFDFEIVKLANAIQNVQINSYASRQENPTFYWPFVVFLDSKGCVLEGAGGFKNNEASSSFISHEKIEGVIHVPEKSQYILLTPLASAIDLDNRALTNQGQLKLIAIR